MSYLVTGGTGFIGRRLVTALLQRDPNATVWVLVRRGSAGRFERLAAEWGERALPLVGDLTAPQLGLGDEQFTELAGVDHVVHAAAIYDLTAGEAEQRAANVDGTREVLALATTGHLKPVQLVSTLGVYLTRKHLGRVVREDHAPPDVGLYSATVEPAHTVSGPVIAPMSRDEGSGVTKILGKPSPHSADDRAMQLRTKPQAVPALSGASIRPIVQVLAGDTESLMK